MLSLSKLVYHLQFILKTTINLCSEGDEENSSVGKVLIELEILQCSIGSKECFKVKYVQGKIFSDLMPRLYFDYSYYNVFLTPNYTLIVSGGEGVVLVGFLGVLASQCWAADY